MDDDQEKTLKELRHIESVIKMGIIDVMTHGDIHINTIMPPDHFIVPHFAPFLLFLS